MELVLNKKYIISTKNGGISQILDLSVQVIGIISYESTKAIAYDIKVLAINEAVLDEGDDAESFLQDLTFYHLRDINTNKDYIVWADIIDDIKTNPLDIIFSYRMKLTLSASLNAPITTVISNISNYIESTYGSTVQPLITLIEGDDSTDLELLLAKVTSYEAVLSSLEKVSGVLSQIERLSSEDITNQITDIQTNITQISSDLSKIAGVI